MREHNRIARQLVFHNPVWLDDRIYEEARRIVIAEYQHIIFNEWLPLIVGSELMEKFGLFPLTSGHSKLYLDTFDPRVSNEFATAAFRFGHSLIPTSFRKISGSTKRNSRSASLNMKDIFFKPQIFMTNKSEPFLIYLPVVEINFSHNKIIVWTPPNNPLVNYSGEILTIELFGHIL